MGIVILVLRFFLRSVGFRVGCVMVVLLFMVFWYVLSEFGDSRSWVLMSRKVF